MAQSRSAGLQSAWASKSAKVAARVRVDWDRDGTYTDLYEDISGRVVSVTLRHAIYDPLAGLPVLGMAAPSQATVVVDNSDRWFSPSNMNGLRGTYSQIALGIYRFPVIIELGYEVSGAPEYLTQFVGEIEGADEQESYGEARVTFTCTDRSIGLLQYKSSTLVQENKRADEVILSILSAAGATGGASLDQAMSIIPYSWMDDENDWDECRLLAQSDGGMFYFGKEGGATFRRMTAPIERTDSRVPVAILNQGNTTTYRDAIAWRDCYSEIIVKWAGRYLAPLDVLYEAPSAVIVPPGQTITEECRLRHPALDTVSPVYGVDYTAISSAFVQVPYGAGGVQIGVTKYGQRVELEISNGLQYDMLYLCNLQVRGYPLLGDEAQEAHFEQTEGQILGDKVYTVEGNPYVQQKLQVIRMGPYMRDRLQRPRRIFEWRGPACPWLELLDRVTLSHQTMSPNPGTNTDCYVVGIEESYAVGAMWMQSLILLPVTDVFRRTDYFLIGTTAYGSYGRAGY